MTEPGTRLDVACPSCGAAVPAERCFDNEAFYLLLCSSVVKLLALDTPAVEQHYGHVDAAVTRLPDAAAQSVEVELVELMEVETRRPVERHTGARSDVGEGRDCDLSLLPGQPAACSQTWSRMKL